MIVVRLIGGLGNQMFCYAAARRLAHHVGTELKLDLSDYRRGSDRRPKGLEAFSRKFTLDDFDITASEATECEIAVLRDRFVTFSALDRLVRLVRRIYPKFLWSKSHFRERSYRFDERILRLGDNCYLSGFWQSEKYFADAEVIIRQEFTPRDSRVAEYAESYLANLRRGHSSDVVSVHIRRGDLAYANERLSNPSLVYGPPVSLDYIHTALDRFDSSCRFLVFSDSASDLQWCKENISREGLIFSENHSEVQDFALMSACDHHIISNSTYGWWAAWLNPSPTKRVIAPRNWFASSQRADLVIDDLIPPGWEII